MARIRLAESTPGGDILQLEYDDRIVLVDVVVNDSDRYEEYKKLAPPAIAAYGGKYLARGGRTEVLEGNWPLNRFVILEFESVERAKQWHESPEYREARALRHETASSKMVVVEGL